MTCQCLSSAKIEMPGGTEIGGTPMPNAVERPICNIRRKPDLYAWAGKCNQTPHEGPCWFWVDKNGNQPDIEFNMYRSKSKGSG
jgi:hypothetical protein